MHAQSVTHCNPRILVQECAEHELLTFLRYRAVRRGYRLHARSITPCLLRGAGYRKLALRMVALRCRGMEQSVDLLLVIE